MGSSDSKPSDKDQKSSSQIHLSLPRSEFFSGDVISGQVLIDFTSSYKAKSLIIQLIGLEETYFLQEESKNDDSFSVSKKGYKNGYNKFHDLKINAYDFSQGNEGGRSILGQWQLPFQIVVADYLPTSFNYQQSQHHGCSLKYMLFAYIEPYEASKQTIQVSQEIKVVQPYTMLENTPQSESSSPTPILCFCCFLGSIEMQVQTNKRCYDQLEEMSLIVNCDASRSSNDIPHFNIKLQSRLVMKSNTGEYAEQTFDLCNQVVQTDDKKVNKTVKLRIPKQSRLGTKGQLITYQHFVIIEPHISTILQINSNPPLSLEFYISQFQKNNNDVEQKGSLPYQNRVYAQQNIIGQIPQNIQYPIMIEPSQIELQQQGQEHNKFNNNNQFSQPNYNYPSESVVQKVPINSMPPPFMKNPVSTVT